MLSWLTGDAGNRADKPSRRELEGRIRRVEAKLDFVLSQLGIEYQSSLFDVILRSPGPDKLLVVKAIRDHLGCSLREAKELTEGTPKVLASAVDEDLAETFKSKIERQGGVVVMERT